MIVEDELIISLASARMVQKLGHRVLVQASSGEEAIARLEFLRPDLVFMDIHLEGSLDGIETGAIIRERWNVPIAYASAFTDDKTRRRAEETEPVGFMAKPLTLRTFKDFFDSYLRTLVV